MVLQSVIATVTVHSKFARLRFSVLIIGGITFN